MFIFLKVFSNIFSISATAGDDTVCISPSNTFLYKAAATSVHSSVHPPTTFGVFLVLKSLLPGSTLSGENAKKKSSPHFKPLFSNIGLSTYSVLPG